MNLRKILTSRLILHLHAQEGAYFTRTLEENLAGRLRYRCDHPPLFPASPLDVPSLSSLASSYATYDWIVRNK